MTVSDEKARDILAKKLNTAIDDWVVWTKFDNLAEGHNNLTVTDSYGRNYARTTINSIFGEEYLLTGSRLELDDGLWSPSEVAKCFGDDWNGVCDFACCTSAYLAEETWCQHPRATFRADARLLYPDLIITAIRCVINRLTSEYEPGMGVAEAYMSIAYECDRMYGG